MVWGRRDVGGACHALAPFLPFRVVVQFKRQCVRVRLIEREELFGVVVWRFSPICLICCLTRCGGGGGRVRWIDWVHWA